MDQLLQNLLRPVQRSRSGVTRHEYSRVLASRASLFREQAGGRQNLGERPGRSAPVELTRQRWAEPRQSVSERHPKFIDGAPIVLRAEIEDNRLKLSLSDSGYGFPENIREHLFEPFATGRPDEQDWGWRSSGRSSRPTAGARTLNTETTARRSPWTFQLDRTNERHRADR